MTAFSFEKSVDLPAIAEYDSIRSGGLPQQASTLYLIQFGVIKSANI
jgi:hypothetical protein